MYRGPSQPSGVSDLAQRRGKRAHSHSEIWPKRAPFRLIYHQSLAMYSSWREVSVTNHAGEATLDISLGFYADSNMGRQAQCLKSILEKGRTKSSIHLFIYIQKIQSTKSEVFSRSKKPNYTYNLCKLQFQTLRIKALQLSIRVGIPRDEGCHRLAIPTRHNQKSDLRSRCCIVKKKLMKRRLHQ